MPRRNVIKIDAPHQYYHVYSRGVNKQEIFRDDADYQYFFSLIARYVSLDPQSSRLTSYTHLRGRIEVLAYCLMPNHFHMLIYQSDAGSMEQLMRGILTSYSAYFNRKYERTGPLYESRYKASCISTDSYLRHISRYIHLNPRSYRRFRYSSYKAYVEDAIPEWLQPERILDLFSGPQAYEDFVADYEDAKSILDELKKELAQ